eukprot:1251955-Rhodomonas_salina.2
MSWRLLSRWQSCFSRNAPSERQRMTSCTMRCAACTSAAAIAICAPATSTAIAIPWSSSGGGVSDVLKSGRARGRGRE